MIKLIDLQRELNNRSYYEFVKYFWDTIERVPFVDNWHIKHICDKLQIVVQNNIKKIPSKRTLINVSPGSSKSLLCNVFLSAYIWSLDPTKKILGASCDMPLAIDLNTKLRDVIESEKYKEMYKVTLRRDKHNKKAFQNTAGGVRVATSSMTTVIGQHFDFFLFDDALSPKENYTKEQLEDVIKWINWIETTRKAGDKKCNVSIMIMQRLYENDPAGYWIDNYDIDHICLPAKLNNNIYPSELATNYVNGLFDPNRMDEAFLSEALKNLGTIKYTCQYLQSPIAEGGNFFKLEWFKTFKEIDYKECYIIADTASKTGEMNDYTAIGAYTKIDNRLYQIDIKRFKVEFPDLIKKLKEFYRMYNPRKIYIEDKSSGTALIQDLRKGGLPVFALQRSKSKEERARNISPKVEAGFCYIRENENEFLSEALQFPKSKNDDMIDVFISAVEVLLYNDNNKLNKVNVQLW